MQSGDTEYRKTYTLKNKLQILDQWKASKCSVRSFAKAHGLGETTLRRWKNQEEQFRAVDVIRKCNTRKLRQLPGSGRKSFFPDIEDRLYKWVQDRNAEGLRVKEKYIIAKVKALIEEEIAVLMVEGVEKAKEVEKMRSFKASGSWCDRFKKRFNLVSRRVTSARSLPKGFQTIAVDYLTEVQGIISGYNIKPQNIVNFDQVPRYFETENNSTITTKGTQNVSVKKASSSHKRFTLTPVINAAGDFLALHLLFSGLKNKPLVDESCLVDVNKTGMWNETVLKRVVDEVIVKKCQTCFQEPVLIILDSYGTHVKFVNGHKEAYERRNIHFSIIPPSMTGLLQPLDVSVNRSFQQAYNDKYTEYMTQAVSKGSFRTKSGNIAMPKYRVVSEWVLDWSRSMPQEIIKKSFAVCGLTSNEDFAVDKLHAPLADCFLGVSEATWNREHAGGINPTPDPLVEDAWTIFDEEFPLSHAFYEAVQEEEFFEYWHNNFNDLVINHISNHDHLKELFDDGDQIRFRNGILTESGIDFLAAAQILKLNITITEYDDLFNTIQVTEHKYCDDVAAENLEFFFQQSLNVVGVYKRI